MLAKTSAESPQEWQYSGIHLQISSLALFQGALHGQTVSFITCLIKYHANTCILYAVITLANIRQLTPLLALNMPSHLNSLGMGCIFSHLQLTNCFDFHLVLKYPIAVYIESPDSPCLAIVGCYKRTCCVLCTSMARMAIHVFHRGTGWIVIIQPVRIHDIQIRMCTEMLR